MGNTRVDTSAVRAAAQRFEAAAGVLERASLSRLHFDGSVAGRMHTGHGDAVRAALERLAGSVAQWARAADEVAVALRVTADRYGDAELRAAVR
ncbi:type VII secretion target [Mycolicibacterium sphagni]|uniref:ESX-1 secretion-associated protein n=1 Tax=Mycolicibacterium sphagni TaxID=1786 RepID=A0A255DQC5_9MYCO|nr:type VII secretion target [Mycolicibacterium sphagni]MCV7178290.1 hypothetical protein [Mycolicibacterium sphagni]OYN79182.1 hypothetical protein CG716_12475 [Mycolicibacterium sphagni]